MSIKFPAQEISQHYFPLPLAGKTADCYTAMPDEELPLPPEGGAGGKLEGLPTPRLLAHCCLLFKRRAAAIGSSSEPLLSEELSPKARGL